MSSSMTMCSPFFVIYSHRFSLCFIIRQVSRPSRQICRILRIPLRSGNADRLCCRIFHCRLRFGSSLPDFYFKQFSRRGFSNISLSLLDFMDVFSFFLPNSLYFSEIRQRLVFLLPDYLSFPKIRQQSL